MVKKPDYDNSIFHLEKAIKIKKDFVRDALVKAEEDSKNADISDQTKYLLDQKIEVLKSLTLN